MCARRVRIVVRTRRGPIGFKVPFGGYLLENWGAPFVVAFMGLLMSAAAFLSLGAEATAELLAEYAYYFLVAGVLLQTLSYLYYEQRGAGPEREALAERRVIAREEGLRRALAESKAVVPDRLLERFEDLGFRFTVYLAHGDAARPGLWAILESVREGMAGEHVALDLYAWLRLLGLRHLAYLFEFPMGRPWDGVSREMREGTLLHRGDRVFGADLLALPEVREEVGRLLDFLGGNPPGSGEFRRLATLKWAVRARYDVIRRGASLDELIRRYSGESAALEHGSLLRAARVLDGIARLAEACSCPPMVALVAL